MLGGRGTWGSGEYRKTRHGEVARTGLGEGVGKPFPEFRVYCVGRAGMLSNLKWSPLVVMACCSQQCP